VRFIVLSAAGLGFCHGKKYFCQDGGKKPLKTMVITGKNWNKLRLA